MQGADLTGAQLQFADFSSAGLQGAVLNFALLQATVLRDAELQAASLQQVKLQGTDMTGTKMTGADLRGAIIWMTSPPEWDTTGLADLSELGIRPLDEARACRAQGRASTRVPDEAARASRQGSWPCRSPRSAKTWVGTARSVALAELVGRLAAAAGRQLQGRPHDLSDEAHVRRPLERRFDRHRRCAARRVAQFRGDVTPSTTDCAPTPARPRR